MITPEDEATLQRLLGRDEFPQDLVDEVSLRTQMFHRSGHSGPLGAQCLIDACRSLKYQPTLAPKAEGKVDWRNYPSDGSVRVSAGPFFGAYKEGVFLGFIEAGMLAVRLDEDDRYVREIRQDMVKLAPQRVSIDPDDLPDARVSLLGKGNFSDAELDTVRTGSDGADSDGAASDSVSGEGLSSVAVADKPKRKKREPIEQPLEYTAEEFSFDWATAESGKPVWVEINEDIVDGIFEGLTDEGLVKVNINGEVKEVAQDAVTYSG